MMRRCGGVDEFRPAGVERARFQISEKMPLIMTFSDWLARSFCRSYICAMDTFDYAAPAQLFHPLRTGRRAPLSFHRFDTSAEAIKYAVEELSPFMLHDAVLEVDDDRFGGPVIRELYNDRAFPLQRRPA